MKRLGSYITFILVLASMTNPSSGFSITGRYTVQIFNVKNPGNADVHCASKDDDLGHHILKTGDEYDFSFGMDFFGRTRFWCDFVVGDNLGGHFDVFLSRPSFLATCDPDDRKICTWYIEQDGLYHFNSQTRSIYKWSDWHRLP